MQKLKMFFRKYYGLFFLAAAIGMVAIMVQVGEAIRVKHEKYLREHPEVKWKDGEMITVYKNDEADSAEGKEALKQIRSHIKKIEGLVGRVKTEDGKKTINDLIKKIAKE